MGREEKKRNEHLREIVREELNREDVAGEAQWGSDETE